MAMRIVMVTGILAALAVPASAATKPKVPASVVLTNGRAAAANRVVLTVSDKPVPVPGPLASQGRTIVKLPKGAACLVGVSASFDDNTRAETHVDVCEDNAILFVP